MNYMTLVYIIFTWLIAMIAINIYRGKQEKSNKGGKPVGKHFNGRFFW